MDQTALANPEEGIFSTDFQCFAEPWGIFSRIFAGAGWRSGLS